MDTAAATDGRFGAAFEWLQIERAWTRTRGSSTAIAIVDRGVQLDHPLLGPNIQPNSGHRPVPANPVEVSGTHAAGVAAGRTSDIEGFSGVAPHARILPVRVGTGTEALDFAHAIEYAVELGAAIINLPHDGDPAQPAVRRAIEYAATRNALVVCSVTDASAAATHAGEPPNQLTVLSVDTRCGALPNYLGPATQPDAAHHAAGRPAAAHLAAAHLAAPGFARVPRWRGSGHLALRDAAIGASYVSGCAALVKAQNPSWGYYELKEHLLASGRPLAALAGRCRSGRLLDVARAVVGPIELAAGAGSLTWMPGGDALLRWRLAYRSAYCVNVCASFRPHGELRWKDLAYARAADGRMTIRAAALSAPGMLRVVCRESHFHSDEVEVVR